MKKDKAINKNSKSLLDQITKTVLYEGYSLYPYYRSSPKNAKPVPFGAVYPEGYRKHHPDVHSTTQTECIVEGTEDTKIEITVRFLHLRNRQLLKIDHDEMGPGQFTPTDTLQEGDRQYHSGWEAVEREISVGTHAVSKILATDVNVNIEFKAEQANDIIYGDDGTVAGNVILKQSALDGQITVLAHPAGNQKQGYKITVQINNLTTIDNPEGSSRNDVYKHAFLSTHTILQTPKAKFISQTDPGDKWEANIEACENMNTWPILVEQDDKTMLSSPIVLYDYPEIASESMGDMFDSTEIEEALVLHMATMPEAEKEKIEQGDPKMKAMMERVESVTPEEIMSLHGGFKEVKSKDNEQ
jgi:hypothetical protein